MFYRQTSKIALWLVLAMLSAPLFGAKVIKINKKKRLVLVNGGKRRGFKKKVKVCFFRQTKKVACGVVVKATKKKAMVRVKKRLKKIRKGYRAVPAVRQKIKVKFKKKRIKAKKLKRPRHKYAAKLHYMPSIMSPNTYNKIYYEPPVASGETLTLWNVGEFGAVNSEMALAFGGEFELTKLRLAVGGRFKSFAPFNIASDYQSDSQDKYVLTDISATAFGFYVDYLYPLGPIKIGGGLDFEMQNVSFGAQLVDEATGEPPSYLYSFTSSLTTMALRIPVRYEFSMGKVGLSFGLTPMIPFALGAATPDLPDQTAADENIKQLPEEYQLTDVFLALGHGSQSFALEALVGVYYGF